MNTRTYIIKILGYNSLHEDTRANICSPVVDGSHHWNGCRGKWTKFSD